MTEADLRRRVIESARYAGWLVAYFPDSRRIVGDRGIPDLIAVKDGMVLLIELKGTRGRLTASQRRWQDATGEHWRECRPETFEELAEELRHRVS